MKAMEIKIYADPRKIPEIIGALRNINGVSIPVNYGINADVDYVDLGLPSGTLWATCNLGANKPEEYGKYFAWGDTEGHTSDTSDGHSFDFEHAPFNNDYFDYDRTFFTSIKDIICPDGILSPEYDAATQNLGGKWRMPTHEEWKELLNSTRVTWVPMNGIKGLKFTASNGKSIFLPASGYRFYTSLNYQGLYGGYWSSSIFVNSLGYAWNMYFYRCNPFPNGLNNRYYGFSIRPVMSKN